MIKSITPVQRRWITVFLTLSIAFLSGHLMQSSGDDHVASGVGAAPPELPVAPVVTSSLTPVPDLRARILATRSERSAGCDLELDLAGTPGGLLHVVLDAPCYPRTPLTVRFNQLIATDATDARGRWEKTLPAISPGATISISIADKTVARRFQHTQVAAQHHVILAWTGAQTFHIRLDDPIDADLPTRLGDNGKFFKVGDGTGAAFEVFSFSADTAGSRSVVRVSVDALVTRENCGRTATTLAYQTGYLGTLRPTEIAYTMPDCDRVGDVVRLQNLFRDLRLAER